MTCPTSKCLSIVFAFFLVTGTWGSNTSAKRSYLHPTSGGEGDNYDVIDVANQKSNNGMNKMLTGQTTRISLTSEVDDDFWLKHLGEDYKHAVHLMVGGRNDPQNSYRGEHNMKSQFYGNPIQTENHRSRTKSKPEYQETKTIVQPEIKTEQLANYNHNKHEATKTDDQETQAKIEVKEPYEMSEKPNETPRESPVESMENVENEEIDTYTTESIDIMESSTSANTTDTNVLPSTEIKSSNDDDSSKKTAIQQTKNETEHVTPKNSYPEDKTYEQIFAIGDKLANTFYNPNSFHLPDEKPNKNLHYTDTLHKYSTQHKYTNFDSRTDYKHTQTEQHPTAMTTATDDREYSGDGDHLGEGDFSTNLQQKPVIINLPESPKSTVQQLSDTVTPVVVKIPPVIYHQKAKQYYRPSRQQSTLEATTPQNTQQNTQQQTLPYPLSQNYPSYYSQPQTPQQQQQQQQSPQQHHQLYPQYQNSYYNPILADSYDQSSYTEQNNFYQPSSQMMPNEQTVDSIPALRYILGKSAPPIAPYAEMHREQLPNNADTNLYDGYTRVSRSYRKYFNDGL